MASECSGTGAVVGREDLSLTSSKPQNNDAAPPERVQRRLDLHNHTVFSRDGSMKPLELLERAAARGLDAVAVTDHDRLEGALECAALAAADPSLPRVIVGEEMLSLQGDIVGLFLQEQIPGGLDVRDTISLIREQGGIPYLPHPFDRHRRATMDPDVVEEVGTLVDLIEVANGRALTTRANPRALQLAARHGRRLGAGSDAHYPGEIGRCYLELPAIPDRQGFLDALRFARPHAPAALEGVVRSWFFCLRTGFLVTARRRSVLPRPAGG